MTTRHLTCGLIVVAMVLLTRSDAHAIAYIPAIPDNRTVLPANDGEPDGCNSSRFKCVMGGWAVLDIQTGLTWARNADLAGKKMSWKDAEIFCQDIEIFNRKGWRLPSRNQIITLLDTSQSSPALPAGHPFKNVGTIGSIYWTSTEQKGDKDIVWIVKMKLGIVTEYLKIFGAYAWPVLGSN